MTTKEMTMRTFVLIALAACTTACGVEVPEGKIRDIARQEAEKIGAKPTAPATEYEAAFTLPANLSVAASGFEEEFCSNFDADGVWRCKAPQEKGRIVGWVGALSEERLRAGLCLATDVGKDQTKCAYVANARYRTGPGEWQYLVVLSGGQEVILIPGAEFTVRGPKPVVWRRSPNGIGGGNVQLSL